MAATVDHLRVDHRITVLRAFADSAGVEVPAGEHGVLRGLSIDWRNFDITMEIERAAGKKLTLRFVSSAKTGPRNGHMKEYFELGDYVVVAGAAASVRHDPALRKMIVPAAQRESAASSSPAGRQAQDLDGPDRLEAAERQMQREIQHIGASASIAEMYAQRMRAFQRAGNEPRAVAAFKLATQWMDTYAGQATSGGEGEALSLERDQFHAALVREFGYDPTRAQG